MCGKIHFENYKYAMYNYDTGARMSLTGVGCRLQTCSRLASERFNSAFCAPIFTWEQTLKKKKKKNLHTHINYATCTGNHMCFFYEALYLLFFFHLLFVLPIFLPNHTLYRVNFSSFGLKPAQL